MLSSAPRLLRATAAGVVGAVSVSLAAVAAALAITLRAHGDSSTTVAPSRPMLADKAGRPLPGARPGEADVVALKADGTPIERYTSATPHETFTGEIEALPMWAGQGVHAVKRVQSAADILRELVGETQRCLYGL